MTVYADADADWVYNFAKALDESYDLYKDAHAKLKEWKIEIAGVPPADAPFHEGAVKYYKEKGVWKTEHDRWNTQRIEHMRLLQAEWEKTVQGASGMKSAEFQEHWMKQRAKALGLR